MNIFKRVTIPYFNNLEYYGVRAFVEYLQLMIISEDETFLYKDGQALANKTDKGGLESYLEIHYRKEDSSMGETLNNAGGMSREFFIDKQISLGGYYKQKNLAITVRFKSKSETDIFEKHGLFELRKDSGYTQYAFDIPYRYTLPTSITALFNVVNEARNICLGKTTSLNEYMNLSLQGTHAGKDGPLDMTIRENHTGNIAILKEQEPVEYDNDTSFYTFAITFNATISTLSSMTVGISPTIYNRISPTIVREIFGITKPQGKFDKLETNLPSPVVKTPSDTFYKLVDEDTLTSIIPPDHFKILFSALLTTDDSHIYLNLKELGDYQLSDTFLNNVEKGMESECVSFMVLINGEYSNITATVKDNNVFFSRKPACNETIHLLCLVHDNSMFDCNLSGKMICRTKDNKIIDCITLDGVDNNNGRIRRLTVLHSDIVVHKFDEAHHTDVYNRFR